MPFVEVRGPLSGLCQQRYQLRAASSVAACPGRHVSERTENPFSYALVDHLPLDLLELQLQCPIRAHIHVQIICPPLSS